MRNRWIARKILVSVVIAFMIAFSMVSGNTLQAGAMESRGGMAASSEETAQKGKRTVLLYLCGSDLETHSKMASFNLRQILAATFSADEDVRFLIMTGGCKGWHADTKWLVFPEDVNVPDDAVMGVDEDNNPEPEDKTSQISNTYNQVWEAKGADAPENAGKMVLLDGDGITGPDGTAVPSTQELMSDPEILKAFINYGVEHYPADRYDLILWDHGGGPTGGFAYDEHDEDGKMMSFSGIVDALSHNKVVDSDENGAPDGRFDLVDFDACLMSSIELQLVLADYTDYYISSPETEPGYGQFYTGWLNTVGENPDVDTYAMGRQIVDDFMNFYEVGQGVGQEATLTLTDTRKFIRSGITDALADMNQLMKDQALANLFYDELRSFDGSIRYADDNFFDLGNLASLLTVRNSEVSEEELDGQGEISNSNVYYEKELTSRICAILQDVEDKDMIYGRGTDGVVSKDQYIRNMDGSCQLSDLHTSGVYIFFPSPDMVSYAIDYYDQVTQIIETMPDKDDGRYAFLNAYRKTVIDYALIGLTGRTVNKLINQENMNKADIDYNAVRNYWCEGKTESEDLNYTDWADLAQPLFERREGGEEGAAGWLDSLIKQQAEEALSLENISAKEVRTKTGTGYKIHINDVRNRCITGIRRNVTAEIPVLQDYMEEYFDEEGRQALASGSSIALGSVEGTLDYSSELNIDSSPSDIIRWMNKKESSWDVSPVEEKWYAINDADKKLHLAAIYKEKENSYYVVGLDEADEDSDPVILVFNKEDDSDTRKSTLSEVIFVSHDGSTRPVKASELTETVDFRSVIYTTYYVSEFFLPISENTFQITADNAGSITMSYTDVRNISDIKDTDGDKRVLHSTFTVSDIYNNNIDISDKVNATNEKIVDIKLARIKTGIYNDGEIVTPEVVYNGETLKEGEDGDYTWEFNLPEGTVPPELRECGEYDLLLKGHGRFTGYADKTFYIVQGEEAAQAKLDEARTEMEEATAAVEEAKASGNKDQLNAAYERLVAAQNAVTDALTEYAKTKDALDKEKQEELEQAIFMLEDQMADLTIALNEAMVIDISNFAVTMETVVEFDDMGNEIEVSVAGLDPEDYNVVYDDNYEVGTAKVIIRPKNHKYKGEIIRTYQIIPKSEEAPDDPDKDKVSPEKVSPDVRLSETSYVYDGKAKTPEVIVEEENHIYKKDKDYTVTYPAGRTDVGTYKVKVVMTGSYTGSFTRTFQIAKAANKMKIKAKNVTVRYSKLKKKAQTLKVKKVLRFTKKGQGAKTYQKIKGSRKIVIDAKTGDVTVKKGLKKGTYKVKVKVQAAGDKNYNPMTATVWLKLKVR